MKTIILLVIACIGYSISHAQLVSCRHKICMIDYNYHNDVSPNADMTAIKAAKPDILIDNTPGGYWGEVNGHTGCLPSQYVPLGIEVYSYITGGYEGTKYMDTRDILATNLARVDAIAADGATGVFLDEVTSFPNSADKAYISAIYSRCLIKGLKLILNPGVSTFDSWLMGKCDFLMSDEVYDGSRNPTPSESPYLSRILVVREGVTDATTASNVTLAARAKGFGYSYVCNAYTTLPSWLSSYLSTITQPPATPVITMVGGSLQSNGQYGNQWYEATSGSISGAVNQILVPSTNGYYFTIVTLQGCRSDTSNRIHITTVDINRLSKENELHLYPNPTSNVINAIVDIPGVWEVEFSISDALGRVHISRRLSKHDNLVDISGLTDGLYTVSARWPDGVVNKMIVVQK